MSLKEALNHKVNSDELERARVRALWKHNADYRGTSYQKTFSTL